VAQRLEWRAGVPHIFTSTSPGTGGGTITYQWYRDGQPIAGATDSTYILLDHLAYGTNVVFQRGAISSSCPGNVVYSPAINVAFGLRVDTVFWASVNVDNFQTFAARPDMYTKLYQWDRNVAWAITDDAVGWSSTNTSPSWSINPCPAGWRLPTMLEYAALVNTGYTFAGANTRGNAVAGGFLGPNSVTCTLPNNMYNCIFLPAGGRREYYDGGLHDTQGTYGYYWSSTVYDVDYAYHLRFVNGTISASSNYFKGRGCGIRCVK